MPRVPSAASDPDTAHGRPVPKSFFRSSARCRAISPRRDGSWSRLILREKGTKFTLIVMARVDRAWRWLNVSPATRLPGVGLPHRVAEDGGEYDRREQKEHLLDRRNNRRDPRRDPYRLCVRLDPDRRRIRASFLPATNSSRRRKGASFFAEPYPARAGLPGPDAGDSVRPMLTRQAQDRLSRIR